MIEAVKSSIAASPALKAGLEQSSSSRNFVAESGKGAPVPAAPFVSPTVRVDVNTKIAILEFKESDTGEVVMQVPSERQISAYKEREVREKAEILTKLSRRPELGGDAGASSSASAPQAPQAPSGAQGTSALSEQAAPDIRAPQADIQLSSPKVSVSTTGIDA